MDLSESDRDHLKTLEEELWKAETRFNKSYMEKVFSPDLFEFGRSGRIHTREDLLSAKASEIKAQFPLEDLKIRLISDNVAQVTYNSHVEYGGVIESARRSSIWSFTDREWVLRFHQGTPIG
jgi:hypothetical protein